jgi:hypothetical protein
MDLSTRAQRSARLLVAMATLPLFIAIAGGCTTGLGETRLVVPTAPEAEACVAACDLEQKQCEQRQRVREETCGTHFDDSNAELSTCLATPGTLCVRPTRCLGLDLSVCKIQHQECILACGGSLERTGLSLPSRT